MKPASPLYMYYFIFIIHTLHYCYYYKRRHVYTRMFRISKINIRYKKYEWTVQVVVFEQHDHFIRHYHYVFFMILLSTLYTDFLYFYMSYMYESVVLCIHIYSFLYFLKISLTNTYFNVYSVCVYCVFVCCWQTESFRFLFEMSK